MDEIQDRKDELRFDDEGLDRLPEGLLTPHEMHQVCEIAERELTSPKGVGVDVHEEDEDEEME